MPTIEARRRGGQLVLRRAASSESIVLEQSGTLRAPWAVPPGSASLVDGHFELEIDPAAAGAMFYRLRSPGSGTPALMGLVQDHQALSVPSAIVGELQPTDQEGTFSGLVQQTASGWISVWAMGHARSYAAPAGTLGGTQLVEAWLTPFGDQQELAAGESVRLFLGESDAPTADITASADDFAGVPVVLGLAMINPLDVGPLFADLDTGSGRHLSVAFALDARTPVGASISPAAGRSLRTPCCLDRTDSSKS